MDPPCGIHKISNDVLKDILDFVVVDPERFINIDRRAHLFYLSVESFKQLPPPSSVGDYRWVCKRFAELLLPHQFTRITTRFSRAGFERLDNISKNPYLANYTRKFSYMIPLLYVKAQDDIHELSSSGSFSQQDIDQLTRKVEEQRRLVPSREDVASLRRAMTAFTSLQHVHIFRLEDKLDGKVLKWADRNVDAATPPVNLKWTPAWSHAVRTIGEALLHAQSPFSRFSGQWLNSQSALELSRSPTHSISFLAERLTCLELHFDAGQNERMRELSGLFKTVFTAARNMQAVHIGFPSHLELGLEEIFHNVRWDKLRAFGIQAWRLDAEEIINIARRHRKTLRGLRLRDVLLKEGSMWKDVLWMLHDEMEVLEWVSLRRIGYARDFNNFEGFDITDIDLSISDSDNDNEGGLLGPISEGDERDDEAPDEGHYEEHDEEYNEEGDVEDSMGDEDSEEELDDDHGPGANELALSPDTPASAPWSVSSWENQTLMTADELGDNGVDVPRDRRKKWEQWVVTRPSNQIHAHPA